MSEINDDAVPHVDTPSPSYPSPSADDWVIVEPPEKQQNDIPDFRFQITGPENLPPQNSDPIVYFLLFFDVFVYTRDQGQAQMDSRVFIKKTKK